MRHTASLALVFAVAASLAPAHVSGQSRSVPRTTGGQPDFSGIWQAVTTASWDIEDHNAQRGVPPGPGIVDGEVPYQPWALAKKRENYAARETADPAAKCYFPGVPRLTYMPFPFQIVQTPGQLTFLHEYVRATRTIYVNGTAHPKGPIDWWLGDSRGHWEGDTLVVDVVHFNDQTWFDHAGNFHSDALHLVERYTPDGPDHINYDVRIEDPKVFTRPWTMSLVLYRHKEKRFQILEYACDAFDVEKYYP